MDKIMIKKLLLSACVLTLVACGGGGGSSAPIVDPGPPPPATPIPDPPSVPDTPIADYASAKELIVTITNVTYTSPPVVEFMVSNEFGVAIQDLTTGNVRFTIAKLIPGTSGSASAWQSYINRLKTPAVNPANPAAIQATYERGGVLNNNNDGTYSYTFLTDIANVTSPMAVAYDPNLTHRVAIQFSGGPAANPTYDWVPATGATSGIETRDVVSIDSCNTCHDPLAIHGGGRVETKYCVTCHNPGTTEPNSLNTVDFKVMVHKIHRGKNLPSVLAGGSYLIYGYGDSLHDYSHLAYPQDIRNCTNCHAGTGTGTGSVDDILTTNGDNWNEVPTQAACGSCHDDVDFAAHQGGQPDDSNCLLCHSEGGFKGSVANSHRNLIHEAMAEFKVNVLNVANTAPGQFPVVNFSVTNPLAADAKYNILTAPEFTGARFVMGVAWSTSDYNNVGNDGTNAAYQTTNPLTNATAVGDGTFNLTSLTAIPDGSVAPFVPATGSGSIIFEGRAKKDVFLTGIPANIPLTFAIDYFSIDEADGVAVPRRQPVTIEKCNVCHDIKINHGSNRTNDTQGCVGCHNPRNTDKVVRLIAGTPPTDGKDEESIDFKTLIHGVHASGFRENPLQVVGFGGFSTHVFDQNEVHFPGRLSNCRTCHVEGAWRLPLADSVLATTIDTGIDILDPADDLMITPAAAVCSSCHDTSLAKGHMEQNGADFTATAASISSGASTEACAICHGPGRTADVDVMHNLNN